VPAPRALFLVCLLGVALPVWAGDVELASSYNSLTDDGTNREATVFINADGTALLRQEIWQPRPLFEKTLRELEAGLRAVGTGEDSASLINPKPYADAELRIALPSLLDKARVETAAFANWRIAEIEFTQGTVRVRYELSLSSLAELLHSYAEWYYLGLYWIREARIESEATGHLKLTFFSTPDRSWLRQTLRDQQGLRIMDSDRSKLTLVFPGKVLSSSLPVTDGNTTSLVLDSRQPIRTVQTLRAFQRPVTIIAESGGLKLTKPISSEDELPPKPSCWDVLPLVDAGAGFITEPTGLTVVTAQFFPAADKRLLENTTAGVTINARVFGPKGRQVVAATAPKVLKAVDDTGRNLLMRSPAKLNVLSDAIPDRPVPVYLWLAPPSPSAQEITEVEAEMVVVTVGKWKELVLTNLQLGASYDLAALLPRTKLTITRLINTKSRQAVRATVTGPLIPDQLHLGFESGTIRKGLFIGSPVTEQGQTSRQVLIEEERWFEPDTPLPPVVIRIPEDPKRERVKVTLRGLDLY